MEFETNTPTEQERIRMEASARQYVIQPVSTSVLPEPSAGADLNTRISETAHQPNVTSDHEDTSIQLKQYAKLQPAENASADAHPNRTKTVATIAIASISTAGAMWLLTQ